MVVFDSWKCIISAQWADSFWEPTRESLCFCFLLSHVSQRSICSVQGSVVSLCEQAACQCATLMYSMLFVHLMQSSYSKMENITANCLPRICLMGGLKPIQTKFALLGSWVGRWRDHQRGNGSLNFVIRPHYHWSQPSALLLMRVFTFHGSLLPFLSWSWFLHHNNTVKQISCRQFFTTSVYFVFMVGNFMASKERWSQKLMINFKDTFRSSVFKKRRDSR